MSAHTALSAPQQLTAATSALHDPRIEAVIARLQREHKRPANAAPNQDGPNRRGPNQDAERDPHRYIDFGFSIHPEQGDLIYLLCRSLRAKRVVEFATSIGMSTLYLAAAMRDNGGGRVISTEFEPSKIAKAQANISAAGLADLVEIRAGDALQTLASGLPDHIDLVLLDGAKSLYPQVLALLEPRLRQGAMIVADNADWCPEYLSRVRTAGNGYLSVPFASDVELSFKL